MSMKIQGMGWITPLGSGLDEVRTRLANGERGEIKEIASPHSANSHRAMIVPPKIADVFARNPRLRRSSAISHFTTCAAAAALENAGIPLTAMTPKIAERTAIIFAIASGGVIYTRKFYEQIATQDASAASPLLFPETVYNAPASHLAALLGITGASYTLVGDSSVGISALKFAEQLLATTEIDRCVVVGGEEIDWVLCEAYAEWRLGALLAEGAAALVVGRENGIAVSEVHDGVSFFDRREASKAICEVMCDLAKSANGDLVIASANGTFIDGAEQAAIDEFFPNAKVVAPKLQLGEAIGASALMQTILGALAIANGEAQRAVVSVLGFNQQASGLSLTAESTQSA